MPEIVLCARWRVEAFSGVIGTSIDEEIALLERLVADQQHQVAIVAERDRATAGTCLLVPSEIEPVHNVSPWLAGLYVSPEHRRHGVGAALVRAIENEARTRGHDTLYLYTTDAVSFYEHLGWAARDRVGWLGYPTVLMARNLRG
jgi:GNAT superfamily N-acetyltransferase